MKTNQTTKTYVIKHKKSFANTRTGQVLDQVIAGAAVTVGTTLAVYVAQTVVNKVEEMKLNHDCNKLFREAKRRYENKMN